MKKFSPNHNRALWQRGRPLKRRVPIRKVNPRNKSRWMPGAVAEAVIRRSGGRCEAWMLDGDRCGDRGEQLHHVLPRSRGGKHEAENLLHLCGWHHLFTIEHPAAARERGWLK